LEINFQGKSIDIGIREGKEVFTKIMVNYQNCATPAEKWINNIRRHPLPHTTFFHDYTMFTRVFGVV